MPENVGYPETNVAQQVQQSQQVLETEQQTQAIEQQQVERQQVEQAELEAELATEVPAAEPTQVETSESLQADSFSSPEQTEAAVTETLAQIEQQPEAANDVQANVSAEEVLGLV